MKIILSYLYLYVWLVVKLMHAQVNIETYVLVYQESLVIYGDVTIEKYW